MKKLKVEEVLQALRYEQHHTCALQMLVRALAPTAGWRFVSSPRAMNAYLVHVDDTGYMVEYDESIGSEERRARDAQLYRIAESEGELDSLLLAFEARGQFFAAHKMTG